jgi:dTDP-4-amino-4,6-dideoxygalactose transaminase
VKPFAGNGARASELTGAMLNVQLDRIDGMISSMRRERNAILDAVAAFSNSGLNAAPLHSQADDCGTHAILTFPSAAAAKDFAGVVPSVIAGRTGRHTYTEWDQVLSGSGAAHPEMNPYNMVANRDCRRIYSRDMCSRSLKILARSVLVPTHPQHSENDIADICHNVVAAAQVVLKGARAEDVKLRNIRPIEARRFDIPEEA